MKVPMNYIFIEDIKDAIFCLTTTMLFYALIIVLVVSIAYIRYEILLPVLHYKISFTQWLLHQPLNLNVFSLNKFSFGSVH
ncbi:MAG: hypothetical protein P4L59_13560 [Desulfosporosinus sp.]|nr:hypothetical protein [Desulfosporosinus sp.]